MEIPKLFTNHYLVAIPRKTYLKLVKKGLNNR